MQLNLLILITISLILNSCSIFWSTPDEIKPVAVNKVSTNYIGNQQYSYCINESCNQPTDLKEITAENLKPLEPENNLNILETQQESKAVFNNSNKKTVKNKAKHIKAKTKTKCPCHKKFKVRKTITKGGKLAK